MKGSGLFNQKYVTNYHQQLRLKTNETTRVKLRIDVMIHQAIRSMFDDDTILLYSYIRIQFAVFDRMAAEIDAIGINSH